MIDAPPITKEERENEVSWANLPDTFGDEDFRGVARSILKYEAALTASEANVKELEARELTLIDVIDAIYLYANDTLSGRADGGPDDRDWQRAAVIEIRNRARQFATVQMAIDARRARAAYGETE